MLDLLDRTIDELKDARRRHPAPGMDNVLSIALCLRALIAGRNRPEDASLVDELSAGLSMRGF